MSSVDSTILKALTPVALTKLNEVLSKTSLARIEAKMFVNEELHLITIGCCGVLELIINDCYDDAPRVGDPPKCPFTIVLDLKTGELTNATLIDPAAAKLKSKARRRAHHDWEEEESGEGEGEGEGEGDESDDELDPYDEPGHQVFPTHILGVAYLKLDGESSLEPVIVVEEKEDVFSYALDISWWRARDGRLLLRQHFPQVGAHQRLAVVDNVVVFCQGGPTKLVSFDGRACTVTSGDESFPQAKRVLYKWTYDALDTRRFVRGVQLPEDSPRNPLGSLFATIRPVRAGDEGVPVPTPCFVDDGVERYAVEARRVSTHPATDDVVLSTQVDSRDTALGNAHSARYNFDTPHHSIVLLLRGGRYRVLKRFHGARGFPLAHTMLANGQCLVLNRVTEGKRGVVEILGDPRVWRARDHAAFPPAFRGVVRALLQLRGQSDTPGAAGWAALPFEVLEYVLDIAWVSLDAARFISCDTPVVMPKPWESNWSDDDRCFYRGSDINEEGKEIGPWRWGDSDDE